MKQSNTNEWSFGPLFRIAGYALLALSLLDLIEMFVPPRFTDPAWEFQLVNNLVERVPVPLLGLVLVLVGEQSFRIFKFLSSACLVVGLLFLLIVPLAASSAWRIERLNQLQFNQQTAQIQQIRAQLNQATTDAEINNVLARLNPQGPPPQINNPQETKRQILGKIAQAEQIAKAQIANRAGTTENRLKRTVKSILGALISAAVFLTIWRKTRKVLRASTKVGGEI